MVQPIRWDRLSLEASRSRLGGGHWVSGAIHVFLKRHLADFEIFHKLNWSILHHLGICIKPPGRKCELRVGVDQILKSSFSDCICASFESIESRSM